MTAYRTHDKLFEKHFPHQYLCTTRSHYTTTSSFKLMSGILYLPTAANDAIAARGPHSHALIATKRFSFSSARFATQVTQKHP